MVGISILPIVHTQLSQQYHSRTSHDWLKLLIRELLHITHRQWLCRNAVVHSLMSDGLTREDQHIVFSASIDQIKAGPEGLLKEDQELLDTDIESLWSRDGLQKKYWLQAVASARRAKLNQERMLSNSPCHST